jgi:hypothetical protein
VWHPDLHETTHTSNQTEEDGYEGDLLLGCESFALTCMLRTR